MSATTQAGWHWPLAQRVRIVPHDQRRRRRALRGTFRTALGDSAFAGAEVPILGLHCGPCVHFAFASAGDMPSIASFTGLLREGKLHTVWHVVSDQAIKPPRPGEPAQRITLPWAHAVLTNSDTFERSN